jgi:tetratricopeptide repeat protein
MTIAGARGRRISPAARPWSPVLLVLIVLLPAGGARASEADLQRLEQAAAAHPDSVEARLALGRAYYDQGRFADAKIEFETVLRFDHLPPDLASQTRAYAKAAEHFLDEDGRLLGFEEVELGLGRYWVRSTSDTGGAEPAQTFYLANLSASLSYLFKNGYSLEGDLDYGGRLFRGSGAHNESDFDWRIGGRRALSNSNIGAGFAGSVNYIGEGDYRYDYGAFIDWHRELSSGDEITAETYVRRRQYPTGELRDRSRTIAELSVDWVHSLLDGKAAVSAGVHGGYQYATSRPDGNSGFYGVTLTGEYTLTDHLGAFASALWEWNDFNTDHIQYHPESLDNAWILRRRDSLYEIDAGLAWEFAPTWLLQPQALYVHDSSNVDDFHYSSVEFWASVRKEF